MFKLDLSVVLLFAILSSSIPPSGGEPRLIHLQSLYVDSQERYFVYQEQSSDSTFLSRREGKAGVSSRVHSVWEADLEDGRVTPLKLRWWVELPSIRVYSNSGRKLVHFFSSSRNDGNQELWVAQANMETPGSGGRLTIFKIPLAEEPPPLARDTDLNRSGDWLSEVNDYIRKVHGAFQTVPSDLYWQEDCFSTSLQAQVDGDRIIALLSCDSGETQIFTFNPESQDWARATLQPVDRENDK